MAVQDLVHRGWHRDGGGAWRRGTYRVVMDDGVKLRDPSVRFVRYHLYDGNRLAGTYVSMDAADAAARTLEGRL